MARKSITAANDNLPSVIDNDLAAEAQALRGALVAPTSKAIKVEPVGRFKLPDGTDLGSEIQVVVVDFLAKNFFYLNQYDPNNIVPPDCYAAADVNVPLIPDPDVPSRQSDACATCMMNQFGSAPNKRAKACKNTYALAVLLVDPNDPQSIASDSAPLYTISLPPHALQSFGGITNTVIRTLNGPPVKAMITLTAENVGTYAKISCLDPIPNPLYAQHVGRRAEAREMLLRKPDFSAATQPPARQAAHPATRRAGSVSKPAAGGRR